MSLKDLHYLPLDGAHGTVHLGTEEHGMRTACGRLVHLDAPRKVSPGDELARVNCRLCHRTTLWHAAVALVAAHIRGTSTSTLATLAREFGAQPYEVAAFMDMGTAYAEHDPLSVLTEEDIRYAWATGLEAMVAQGGGEEMTGQAACRSLCYLPQAPELQRGSSEVSRRSWSFTYLTQSSIADRSARTAARRPLASARRTAFTAAS